MKRPHQRKKVKNPSLKVKRKVSKRQSRRSRPDSLLKTALKSVGDADDIWDVRGTLEENYRKIGVCARVNGVSGGSNDQSSNEISFTSKLDDFSEIDGGFSINEEKEGLPVFQKTLISGGVRSGKSNIKIVEEASVIRDESGHVIGFGGPDDPSDRDEKSHSVSEESERSLFITAIEDYIAKNSGAKKRFASDGEIKFLLECMKKYGSDYSKMAKDIKLNRLQLTENQIERKITKLKNQVDRQN